MPPADSPPPQRVELVVPWATIFKVTIAVAAAWLWQRLVWVVMIFFIAIIIAVGLSPAVERLQKKGCPRWLASWGLVILVVGAMTAFLAITWASLSAQAQHLGQQLSTVERTALQRLPEPLVTLLKRSGATTDASALAPYAMQLGKGALGAFAAFMLAWILVAYLLIEAEATYRWVRGFAPERFRPRFDRTAMEAREVAYGYIVGNVVTSMCAGVYFFAFLVLLKVPAALLLATLAFVCDFIPVIGFFLSLLPALAMAATVSPGTALAMVPIYIGYHFLENYLIAPKVYGGRLRLSNIAVLLAFAIGAELAGVAGALLALPVAAVYPAIEKLWLRDAFGDEVIEEHEAVSDEPDSPIPDRA